MSTAKKTVSFLDVLTGKKENLANDKKTDVLEALSQEENNNTKNHHCPHHSVDEKSGFCPLTKNALVAPNGVTSSLRRNDKNNHDQQQTLSSCDVNNQQESSASTLLLTVSSSCSKSTSLSPLRPPPPLSATFTSITTTVGMLHVFPEFISKSRTNDDEKENQTTNAKTKNSSIKYHAIVGVDLCGNTHFPSSSNQNGFGEKEQLLSELQKNVIQTSIDQTRSCLRYSLSEGESSSSFLSFSSKKFFVSTFSMQQQQQPEQASNGNNSDDSIGQIPASLPQAPPPSPFTFLQQLNYQFSITHVPLSMAKSMCTFVSFKLIPIFSSSSTNGIDDASDEETLSPEFLQTCGVDKDDEKNLLCYQLKLLLQHESSLKYQLSTNKFMRRLQKIQNNNNQEHQQDEHEQCSLCGKIAGPATSIMCSDQHQKLSLGEVKSVLYGSSGEVFISVRNLDERWSHGNAKHSTSSCASSIPPLFVATATSTMCVGGNDFWRKFAPTPQQPHPDTRPPRLVYFIPHRCDSEKHDEYFAMIRSIDVPQGVYVRFFSQEAKQKSGAVVAQNNNNNFKNKHYRKK